MIVVFEYLKLFSYLRIENKLIYLLILRNSWPQKNTKREKETTINLDFETDLITLDPMAKASTFIFGRYLMLSSPGIRWKNQIT